MSALGDMMVAGIPSLVVAIVGIGGVLVTQARADARQERIAESARTAEQNARLIAARQEAGIEFMATIWELARLSREVLPNGADYGDLNASDTTDVDRAFAKCLMLCDPPGRDAAQHLFDALLDYVGTFTDETWEAIGDAEDQFVITVNGETA